ncbi:ABC transporter substrate-binding protein [Bradyrhizobium sp. LHD-71]|uniref:ABC transporter substrate-binding protein n=1 Tax=Bradyrhizobium sp. LHD-71 TaxID=3072141 RepID=UPI00280DCA4B|nr:ABC transporter substrate-binding protein [Bradyrhizobium sp. LHD-71]MDQ8729134.1 ABC transporter substrate-binding protein [Bradyrhizobium sp. LHD-71]
MDRRSLLQLMSVLGGSMALPSWPSTATAQEEAFSLANPSYARMYDNISGFYFKDDVWAKEARARLKWPTPGQPVHDIRVVVPADAPDTVDAFRKWSTDAKEIGIRYQVEQASQARWLELINKHQHGDIEVHPSILRPERIDPAEWLVSRAYGFDRRNYGEWVNEQYDKLIDLQTSESDKDMRLKYVKDAQKILCDDLYTCQFGWGPAIIEAYNAADWDNVVRVRGFGISNFNAIQSFIGMKPKGAKKSVRVGMTALLETTNIIAAGNNMRSIGRMIYDRLAYFDENLNTIPWALESWKQIDDRTWDIKLRDGMQFHDGKLVTIRDLQFTFDFMRKHERGIFWTANRFLASTEITDEGARIIRVKFKEPYAQFESYFLQLNVILPQHIWGNIMQEQKIADDPRQLRIDKPIGSGPFMFGRHRKDTELQLTTNKKHFSKPSINEIWIVATPTLDGLLGRLESQEIDFIESSVISLKPSQVKQAEAMPHVKIVKTDDINWYHGVVRMPWLPWRDYEFRRAWQHSIDRAFLVNVPWEGAGRLPKSNSFLVEGSPWNNPDVPAIPEFDLKKAKDILQAAGYTWGSDGRLLYPPADNKGFRDRVNRVVKEGYTWGGLKMFS